MEVFPIKVIEKNSKNILISAQYRHPSSKDKIFEECLKTFFNRTKKRNESDYFVGDLNLNLLDSYELIKMLIQIVPR